jgi:NAD(P)-dependent dehydrogenase (short-subunit alcohol dehydrogenase family)
MAGLMEGKVALVTGAASGIGRAAAQIFAREGARVVVADVNEEMGHETAELIRQQGGEAVFIPCDVADAGDCEALVRRSVESYDRLDAAFNNAGIEGDLQSRFADGSEANFDRTIAINLKGVWACMKYELRQMFSQGGGAIVNTASVAGLQGVKRGSAYVAAKHGVIGMTKTAALDYATSNIRVNAVCPGMIETPMLQRLDQQSGGRVAGSMARMHPVGRLGAPAEIAEAAVWLCSERASFITGLALPVDGGTTAQ